jgi:hypothetical protein
MPTTLRMFTLPEPALKTLLISPSQTSIGPDCVAYLILPLFLKTCDLQITAMLSEKDKIHHLVADKNCHYHLLCPKQIILFAFQ